LKAGLFFVLTLLNFFHAAHLPRKKNVKMGDIQEPCTVVNSAILIKVLVPDRRERQFKNYTTDSLQWSPRTKY